LFGGNGGGSKGGSGGNGGAGSYAEGGGVFNAGNATFNGVTINITSNQANGQLDFEGFSGVGGVGSEGGSGGSGTGGEGGDSGYGLYFGTTGGTGGDATGGKGGNSGEGGVGIGGGLSNLATGTLSINPQVGARKKSKQATAIDLISSNQADSAPATSAGGGGVATAGPGGSGSLVNGLAGLTVPGAAGTASNSLSEGIGGGAAFIAGGSATLDNTTISGNRASTSNNDVDGMFSS